MSSWLVSRCASSPYGSTFAASLALLNSAQTRAQTTMRRRMPRIGKLCPREVSGRRHPTLIPDKSMTSAGRSEGCTLPKTRRSLVCPCTAFPGPLHHRIALRTYWHSGVAQKPSSTVRKGGGTAFQSAFYICPCQLVVCCSTVEAASTFHRLFKIFIFVK